MLVNVVVDDAKIKAYMDKISPRIAVELRKEIRHQSEEMSKLMKISFLTGGTSFSRLSRRTGTLIKSMGIITPVTGARHGSISGGVHIGGGVPYARVHINRQGTRTTIHAKGKFMTVPYKYGPALTAGGAKRRPGAMDWPTLAYQMTSTGPALVGGKFWPGAKKPISAKTGVGYSSYHTNKTKPVRTGKGYEVYYWLKRQVTVPARVHPEWIVKLRSKFIYQGIKDAISRASKP